MDWPTRATSRAAGALRAAEAAYRALLRDPGFADAVTARYELALVHEQLGKLREAEAGLRWARPALAGGARHRALQPRLVLRAAGDAGPSPSAPSGARWR